MINKDLKFIFLKTSHLVIVALKIFDVLSQAPHVYTVHIQ